MSERQNVANICFDCKNSVPDDRGHGCPWSRKFEPVPGWTAEPVYKQIGTKGRGKRQIVDTYRITACPLFEGDNYKVKHDMTYLSESESDWFLKNIRNILKRWDDE